MEGETPLFDSNNDKGREKEEDRLILAYDTIVRESALLTTTGGILFGFLLSISINTPETFSLINRITLLVALYSITIAISLFVMPVIYHHLQYPYRDLEKFKERSHKFMIFGLIPAGLTLYLALEIALSFTVSREAAFGLAAIPFLLVYVLFKKRK
ncbi:MAG: DUF6328 family protein [Thermoproteota archaeon]|nr:DUF6328 family protein [Thermoproteota archaeon]